MRLRMEQFGWGGNEGEPMNKIKQFYLLILLFPFVLALVGCPTKPDQKPIIVDIDAITSRTPGVSTNRHFLMLPASKDISPGDLEFQEFSRRVSAELIQKGFQPAANLSQADLIIFVGYGIGNPQNNEYSYSMPVFGQTGIASANTFGTINSFGAYSTYSGTTTYTPMYGITGFQSYVGNYTMYFRYLTIDAYDYAAYKKDQSVTELWKATMTSTGTINDLRFVIPYMIVAAGPYLGADTGRKVRVTLQSDDAAVASLRNE